MKSVTYIAGLTQQNDLDPVVRIIKNEFPDEFQWTHDVGNNINVGTLACGFWKDRTVVNVAFPGDDLSVCSGRVMDANTVRAIFDNNAPLEVIVTITMML